MIISNAETLNNWKGTGRKFKLLELIDVFIPAKLAKNGKRFGFARFRACQDIQRLISSINHIKVGSGSLQALTAHGRPKPSSSLPTVPKTPIPPPTPPTYLQKTFLDTIKETPTLTQKPQPTTRDRSNISFTPLPCESEWLAACAFGVLTEPMNTHSVLQISFPTELNSFLTSNQEWTVPIFDILRPWQPKDGPSNRKVWIRAKGIPLHTWSHGFFHTLVSSFGSLTSIATETENKSKLDYAVLQIMTIVFKPISWEITALIDDLSFHINIDEIFQTPNDTILSATLLFPILCYSKPFSISPSTSKPPTLFVHPPPNT
ncbi:hypothetical protein Tsubulata_024610 [Turnera subulata]|uniref:DUF4283 domain-containing protein n=1 Tax=Turnera subulata TaxID=218843 RepID=A0A9Q0J706_9ROSI|nr:hypothetical protein Tsubulata_024610 [Turnera subulata]